MMFLIQIDIFISRCALPNEQDIAYFTPLSPNASSLSYPWDSVQKSYSSCVRYDANFTPEYYAGGQSANNTVPCDRWLFDPEWNTTVSEVGCRPRSKFHFRQTIWLVDKLLERG